MNKHASSSRIYLDYAAATPLDARVQEAMRAYDDEHFVNPHSTHKEGLLAKRMLEDARVGMAEFLGARSDECIFTNGATDALMKAVSGVVSALLDQGTPYTEMHIVMNVTEHSTTRLCIEALARKGVRVSMVGVDQNGIFDTKAFAEALRDDTVLVVCMRVNNETGAVQPIREIRRVLDARYKAQEAYRHTAQDLAMPALLVDASQAPLTMDVRPHEEGIDMLVLDAAKIYGPKRVGLLVVKKDVPFSGWCGTFGKKANDGTPNVAHTLGMRAAYRVAHERRKEDTTRWHELKESFVEALTMRFPSMRVHGDMDATVPHIVNVSFEGIEAEFLASRLDAAGVAVSAKSACLSEGGEGSYVVAAMDPERANNSVRFSFGRDTSREELESVVSILADIVR